MKMILKTARALEFYCDACFEIANEAKVEAYLLPSGAERKRAALRVEEKVRRTAHCDELESLHWDVKPYGE